MFSKIFEKGLLTLKFHLLVHMAAEIKRVGSVKFLDDSSFEDSNSTVNRSYRNTCLKHLTRRAETFEALVE